MDAKALKTTWQQRLIIVGAGILLLISTVAIYAAVVLSGESAKTKAEQTAAEVAELKSIFEEKEAAYNSQVSALSDKYLADFTTYKNRVKSYNSAATDAAGLKTTDLKVGTGTEIAEDTDYYAYYIGWCADESVFDSSFDNYEQPTSLKDPISGQQGLIAGWTEGVIGMKIGGVREISMPGELAYGDSREICGGYNSPLKFVVFAIDPGADFRTAYNEVEESYYDYYMAAYGNE